MTELTLSVFPVLGLLDQAFEEAGYCVVRGPDLIWGGDIHRFHPVADRFDGVIGGPPCQAHSSLTDFRPTMNKYGNMVPEFERVVRESCAAWFLMEQVVGAPVPHVDGYDSQDVLVRDAVVGGLTNRLRRFTFGSRHVTPRFYVDGLALHEPEPEHAVIGGHGPKRGTKVRGFTGRNWKDGAIAQGLSPEWIATMESECPLTAQGLKDAIGNGVPLAMGRAVVSAVSRCIAPPVSLSPGARP